MIATSFCYSCLGVLASVCHTGSTSCHKAVWRAGSMWAIWEKRCSWVGEDTYWFLHHSLLYQAVYCVVVCMWAVSKLMFVCVCLCLCNWKWRLVCSLKKKTLEGCIPVEKVKVQRSVIPSKDNPPPEMNDWLYQFKVWYKFSLYFLDCRMVKTWNTLRHFTAELCDFIGGS